MSGFLVVLAKECRDNIRDRRTIISSFSLAILGPAAFAGLMALVLTTTVGESREPFELVVVGAGNAPNLVRYLGQQNVTLSERELAEPREAVENGIYDLVLVIGADYGERLLAGEVAPVELIYDSSALGKSRRNQLLARQMLAAYGQQLGLLRLQLRGVDPRITAPLYVEEVDVASPAARALSVLATLPYLLVLVIFMGGFYLAIDATAGEREHGSLEPLLSQPIARAQLVLGKLVAASLFSAASLGLFLLSLAISVPLVPLEQIGMSLSISALTCLQIFGVAVPLILFGAALLTVVASFAKSYKEAQTYLTVVILVPTVPLIITQLLNLEASTPLMLVPSLSQASLITALIKGEDLDWGHLALSYLSTSTLAAVLAWVAIRLYRRERILI
ncbi:MAG: ABC transporter permease [Pseudomonadales bacterium]